MLAELTRDWWCGGETDDDDGMSHCEPAASPSTLTHCTHLSFPSLISTQEETAIITPGFFRRTEHAADFRGRVSGRDDFQTLKKLSVPKIRKRFCPLLSKVLVKSWVFRECSGDGVKICLPRASFGSCNPWPQLDKPPGQSPVERVLCGGTRGPPDSDGP